MKYYKRYNMIKIITIIFLIPTICLAIEIPMKYEYTEYKDRYEGVIQFSDASHQDNFDWSFLSSVAVTDKFQDEDYQVNNIIFYYEYDADVDITIRYFGKEYLYLMEPKYKNEIHSYHAKKGLNMISWSNEITNFLSININELCAAIKVRNFQKYPKGIQIIPAIFYGSRIKKPTSLKINGYLFCFNSNMDCDVTFVIRKLDEEAEIQKIKLSHQNAKDPIFVFFNAIEKRLESIKYELEAIINYQDEYNRAHTRTVWYCFDHKRDISLQITKGQN